VLSYEDRVVEAGTLWRTRCAQASDITNASCRRSAPLAWCSVRARHRNLSKSNSPASRCSRHACSITVYHSAKNEVV